MKLWYCFQLLKLVKKELKSFDLFLFFIVLVLFSSNVSFATTRYVKPNGSGNGDGSTWANASSNLQSMIDASVANDEVWVMAGTYMPTKDPFGNSSPTDPRDKTFYLKNQVKIYGSFAGTETLLSERTTAVIASNPSILSGDINSTPATTNDDAYHVVLTVNDDNTTIFDGFTVIKGKANLNSTFLVETLTVSQYYGSGLYNRNSSLSISNCSFTDNNGNVGSGMYNVLASPTISNCSFSNNTAAYNGAGISNYSGSLTISNCSFSNNSTDIGGGIYSSGTSLSINNCSFSNNSASSKGSAMYQQSGSTTTSTINNCNFTNNNGNGGIYFEYTTNTTVNQCTFTGNIGYAIYSYTSTFIINNSSFSANAGGIYSNTNYSGAININNCSFSNNSASEGGGIHNDYSSQVNVTNCSFSNNSATSTGGGIYNGNGGGSSSYARAYIKNCVFWGNSIGGNSSAVGADIGNLITTSSSVYITYSILQLANNTTNYPTAVSTGFFIGNGVKYATDPLFVNASDPDGVDNIWGTADDGLALQNNSPAVNAGLNFGITTSTDITGATRIQNLFIDMGAYENSFSPPPPTFSQLFVKPIAIGTGDGSSWANASANLQAMIDASEANDEVWVAAGTYKPIAYPTGCTNCATTRDYAFILKNQVKVYGSFAGTETLLSQRTPAVIAANPSILSGDIGTPNETSDNVYHVLLSLNDDNLTKLDGFTIINGNANGSGSITTETFDVSRNQGGGLYNGYNSSSIFTNCNFIANNSSFEGGAMLVQNNLSSFTNCNFSGNTSNRGGAVFGTHASPIYTNCTFSSNTATTAGAMYNWDGSSPILTNCSFSNNSAISGAGGMLNLANNVFGDSNPTVKNGVFWGNRKGIVIVSSIDGSAASVSFTDVEGGYAGTNNINQDPLFVNSSDPDGPDNIFATNDDGLALQSNSPIINQGDPITTSPIKDLTDFVRTIPFDLGAYEFRTCSNEVILSSTVYDYSSGNYINLASSSSGKITATNKITGSTKVTYNAKIIELNPGFKAEAGAVFLAAVGGCN